MGQAVTTNPIIIMMINMTVVFIVLTSLSFLIRLIHLIDPTRKVKTEIDSNNSNVNVSKNVNEKISEDAGKIAPEVIAAISAAISAYGFSGQVKAVKIINHENTLWKTSAKFNRLQRD